MSMSPVETDAMFEELDRALATSTPAEAIARLSDALADRGEFRALLDARLLQARLELGLPLVLTGSLADLPEPSRARYEDRYVEAIREVGRKLLEAGEIGAAWAYFRAIAEKEPVAAAIEAYEPVENDETIGQVVEVAFNQGVHPRKGFGLILDHYGTCSAITAFEALPPDEAIRVACADRLVRRAPRRPDGQPPGRDRPARSAPAPRRDAHRRAHRRPRMALRRRLLPPRRLPPGLDRPAHAPADRPLHHRPGGRADRLRPEPLRSASLRGRPPLRGPLRRPRPLPPGPPRPGCGRGDRPFPLQAHRSRPRRPRRGDRRPGPRPTPGPARPGRGGRRAGRRAPRAPPRLGARLPEHRPALPGPRPARPPGRDRPGARETSSITRRPG